MKISLVISTPEVGYWPYALLVGSFEDKVCKAAELGYDGLELLIRDINKVDREMVKSVIKRYGLSLPALITGVLYGLDNLCIISPYPDISKQAISQLYGFLEFAGEYGAVVDIGVLRGRLDRMPEKTDAHKKLVDHFQRAAEYAARVGARITLEPLNRYEIDEIHNAQDGLLWVSEVGHPNFGLMLDTFHMNIEDASFENSLRQAGSHLWHIHISDSNRLSPGQGHINFPSIFSVLKETNYQGFISAEQLALPNPDSAAAMTIDYLRQFD
jgi:5-keto-L-gluconate epimerase